MDDAILDFQGDGWELVQDVLPDGWQDKVRELGAVQRFREFADASSLLRVLFMHLVDGCSLRETAVRAREGGLADVSAVALFKRLRLCGEWFRWMSEGVMRQWLVAPAVDPLTQSGWRVRVVDGSTVSEPGATGSTWRIHYAMQLPSLACDEVTVTDTKVGELLQHFKVRRNDLLIADRAYATRAGIAHVHAHGGAVLVRLNLTNLPLSTAAGRPFRLLARLRTLRLKQAGDWPAWVHDKKGENPVEGRLCAIRKSRAAARRDREKAEREARKKGYKVRPETLEACSYTFLFTTLPTSVPAAAVLESYRGRWQVELAFKRLKSLLELGHLRKVDPQGAKAWLQGKLLVAILIETLLGLPERFSPWGYPLGREPSPLPVA